MKKSGTTVAAHDSDLPEMDWARVGAMTEEEIRAGALADADAQPLPRADEEWTGLTRLPNVKKLRERLGLTQDEFARTYRIPVGMLRDWEQRRKSPDATARAYLMVIERDPKAVAGLLRAA